MTISLDSTQTLKIQATSSDNLSASIVIYYTKKNNNDFSYEEKTYISSAINTTSAVSLLTPANGETFTIKNIYIPNPNTVLFYKFYLFINDTRLYTGTIQPGATWQLIGGTSPVRGIHHIEEIDSGNIRYLNFWSDAAETVNLGSVSIIDGISVITEVITQVDYDALPTKNPNVLYLIQS